MKGMNFLDVLRQFFTPEPKNNQHGMNGIRGCQGLLETGEPNHYRICVLPKKHDGQHSITSDGYELPTRHKVTQ